MYGQEHMGKNIIFAVLSIVNLALSSFCGYAFVALSQDIIVKMGADPYTIDMAGTGMQGGVYRYGFCIAIALFLQLVLLVLNLSVLPFVERDMGRVKQWCAVLAFCGFVVTLAVFKVKIGMNH